MLLKLQVKQSWPVSWMRASWPLSHWQSMTSFWATKASMFFAARARLRSAHDFAQTSQLFWFDGFQVCFLSYLILFDATFGSRRICSIVFKPPTRIAISWKYAPRALWDSEITWWVLDGGVSLKWGKPLPRFNRKDLNIGLDQLDSFFLVSTVETLDS